MTQKKIRKIIDELYSKPPKKTYSTNKADVYHNDDFWSSDILDLKDYGPEKSRNSRYLSVLIDKFSIIISTFPLKTKNAQTMKDFLKNFLYISKRKANLIETDRGEKFF